MKKVLSLLVCLAILVVPMLTVSVSASTVNDWAIGQGYTVNGSTVTANMAKSDNGLVVNYGGKCGYWGGDGMGGGVLYTQQIPIDGLSVTYKIDKSAMLYNGDNWGNMAVKTDDQWFALTLLNKPSYFSGEAVEYHGTGFVLLMQPRINDGVNGLYVCPQLLGQATRDKILKVNSVAQKDADGNFIKVTKKDASGNTIYNTDQAKMWVKKVDKDGKPVYNLDSQGNPVKLYAEDGSYQVDANGNPVYSQASEEVLKYEFLKDAQGNTLYWPAYDSKGVVILDKDGNAVNSETPKFDTTKPVYDAIYETEKVPDKDITAIWPDGGTKSSVSNGWNWTFNTAPGATAWQLFPGIGEGKDITVTFKQLANGKYNVFINGKALVNSDNAAVAIDLGESTVNLGDLANLGMGASSSTHADMQFTIKKVTTALGSVNYTKAPGTPTSVKATAGTKSAKISWKAASSASGYQVFYRLSTSSTYKYAGATTSTSKTISGLTKGKKYYFKVRAYRSCDTVLNYSGYAPTVSAVSK